MPVSVPVSVLVSVLPERGVARVAAVMLMGARARGRRQQQMRRLLEEEATADNVITMPSTILHLIPLEVDSLTAINLSFAIDKT